MAVPSGTVAATARHGKAVLQPSDFAYLGAFKLPTTVEGSSTGAGRGIALRYVGGELRMFSYQNFIPGAGVYEVVVPALKTSAWNIATLSRNWGDIFGGLRSSRNLESGGLYWDDEDARLYWFYNDNYNGINANAPTFGYSVLNDTDGTAVAHGVYNLATGGCKRAQGGITKIPAWFATAYCSGRKFGVGFGGYASIMATGPVSMGPALSAIDPPSVESGALAATHLLGYPYNASGYTACQRPNNYSGGLGLAPSGEIGYFQWTDTIGQSGVWIDLPTKHGLLFAFNIGTGAMWYDSYINAEGADHQWYLYDPADLALVAQGQNQYDVLPSWRQSWQYPDVTYPLPGFEGGAAPPHYINGTAFDSTTNRLYVNVVGSAVNGWNRLIHCYQVS